MSSEEADGDLKSGEMGGCNDGTQDERKTTLGVLCAMFGEDTAPLRAARRQRPADFQGDLPRLQQ